MTGQSANGATRATSISLDEAGRPKTITKTAAGLGNVPATQTITYDSATGKIASTTAGGKTIATTTDTLGRPVSYTEPNGLRETTTYDSQSRPMTLTQVDTSPGGLPGSFTTNMTYDPVTSRLAAQTDSQTGTTTLGYDVAGNITSQVRSGAPGQLTTTYRFDVLGAEVKRAWSMSGQTDPILSESAISNIHGQQVDHTMMSGGHRDYWYDGIGRLTSVADLDGGTCAVRAYRFDVNSNRIGHTTTTAPATSDASGDFTVCPSVASPPPSSEFDSGDRIIDAGYAYDQFGRTTRLPMSDGQVMRVDYNADDLVSTQHVYANALDADAAGGGTNAISTSTYQLDETGQRFATRSASSQDGTSITRTLRYADDGDSPAWTDEGDGTMTRYIHGPGGGLAATASIDKANPSGGAALVWQIANMHGDISATLPASVAMAIQISRPDEYGAGTEQPRYGWLGSQQRAGDTPAGTYLMGVRLYNANTGRFLSTDSVYGGNANAYAYPADPVGDLDLDGRASYPKYSWALCHWWEVGCGAARRAYASSLGWGKEKMARAAGARCFSEGGLRICEKTPRWVGVARLGTTWGTTFLVAARLTTRQPERARLIRHEKEHVRQWQLFGVKFAYLYAWEGLFNGCGNYFEQKAGLADGGYRC